MKKVTALIPAYNSSSYILSTILALKEIPEINDILVVDDGSTDDTFEIVSRADVRVIKHEMNKGKGEALNTGIRETDAEIIALVDSDLGECAKEVRKLVLPVYYNEADMTIARFPAATKKGGFGLAKGFCQWGLHLYTGIWFLSPMSGQRVLTRELIDAISGQFASGWGIEPALTIDAHRKGFRIQEVPVQMTHAETGRNLRGFVHRGKQMLAAAKIFASRIFKF